MRKHLEYKKAYGLRNVDVYSECGNQYSWTFEVIGYKKKDVRIIGKVYKDAYNDRTWVTRIESDAWIDNRIKFNHLTFKLARKYLIKQLRNLKINKGGMY